MYLKSTKKREDEFSPSQNYMFFTFRFTIMPTVVAASHIPANMQEAISKTWMFP